ncbi:receptor-like protein 54 [Humulus lupulus]|uniref:receptor-like protein 54 n=1 Tax=Humulus lupulus TaxID=3486 RepID=UPI002B407D5E|nr:receptor-like protein 54 [Humulus lupulus]
MPPQDRGKGKFDNNPALKQKKAHWEPEDNQIPKQAGKAALGQLQALTVLNLSNNAHTGKIPSSIDDLRKLESLHFSRNNLIESIPTSLEQLTFLSFLNLSFNQLVGRIPKANQLQTFSADSFIGNKRLCGFPLMTKCLDEVGIETLLPNTVKDHKSIDWNLLSVELG